jgi:hypothetical protein
MAFSKIIAESMDLADTYAFTGTVTGAGGITEADMHRITTNFTGNTDPVTNNWERVDDATFSKMGTGISVSSGIFSFPSTGLYFVKANCQMKTSPTNNNLILQGTNDNFSSNDDILSYKTYGTVNSGNPFQTQILETFFNCTNVSTHKVKLNFYASSGLDIKGDTNQNESTIMFLRLGDSQ